MNSILDSLQAMIYFCRFEIDSLRLKQHTSFDVHRIERMNVCKRVCT